MHFCSVKILMRIVLMTIALIDNQHNDDHDDYDDDDDNEDNDDSDDDNDDDVDQAWKVVLKMVLI